MFDIHFRRHFNSKNDYVEVKRNLDTLEQARDSRAVSGDLVVFAGTMDVVPSDEWLWDWEKQDSQSYAQRAMNHG